MPDIRAMLACTGPAQAGGYPRICKQWAAQRADNGMGQASSSI